VENNPMESAWFFAAGWALHYLPYFAFKQNVAKVITYSFSSVIISLRYIFQFS
jgi:dolichyl-phosphate-mannose--protein O-mannosyl transferase